MILLFDTNILLHFLRQSAVSKQIEADFDPFRPTNKLLLSIVSEGEIRSIAIQSNWSVLRRQTLESELLDFAVIPIRSKDIIHRYAEIDAYSQNRMAGKPLPMTARNMSKNDLWIAATASILNAKLLTTDNDFDHLDGVYLDLAKIKV